MMIVVKVRLSVSVVPLNTSPSSPLPGWTVTGWPPCGDALGEVACSTPCSTFCRAASGCFRIASFSCRTARVCGALAIQSEAGTETASAIRATQPNSARMTSTAASGLGSLRRVVNSRIGVWSSNMNSSARVIGSNNSLPR